MSTTDSVKVEHESQTAAPDQILIPTIHNLAHAQSQRIIWALEELHLARGITYKVKNYERTIRNEEVRKVHRLGKAPILTLESTSPSVPVPTVQLQPGLLTESVLILRWLNDEYANGLWEPESEEERRRDTFFAEFAPGTMTGKASLAMMWDVLKDVGPGLLSPLINVVTRPMVNYFLKDMADIWQLLEENLSDELPYFAGRKLGVSDINMSWGMDLSAHRGWFQPEKYPKLGAWHDRIRTRPAYIASLEKGGGYDMGNSAKKK